MCDLQSMLTRIKKEKKKKGYTNESLGVAANIPKGTLDKILSGNIKEPPVTSIMKIAKALDVTTDYLIYGSEVMTDILLDKYDALNSLGRQKATEYINDLLANPKYVLDANSDVTLSKSTTPQKQTYTAQIAAVGSGVQNIEVNVDMDEVQKIYDDLD